MDATVSILRSPKDLLENEEEIKVGDFVTTNDKSEKVEAYVVQSISGLMARMYYLELSEMKDDVYINESIIPTTLLLKLDDSHVNINGLLWNVRESILNNKPLALKKIATW